MATRACTGRFILLLYDALSGVQVPPLFHATSFCARITQLQTAFIPLYLYSSSTYVQQEEQQQMPRTSKYHIYHIVLRTYEFASVCTAWGIYTETHDEPNPRDDRKRDSTLTYTHIVYTNLFTFSCNYDTGCLLHTAVQYYSSSTLIICMMR